MRIRRSVTASLVALMLSGCGARNQLSEGEFSVECSESGYAYLATVTEIDAYAVGGDAPRFLGWEVVTAPSSGAFDLSRDSPSATFGAGELGPYRFEAAFEDHSVRESCFVDLEVTPWMNVSCTEDQTVTIGDRAAVSVTVAGGAGPLTYEWTVPEAPPDSAAGIDSPSTPAASLVPDIHGQYDLRVTVTDALAEAACQSRILAQ